MPITATAFSLRLCLHYKAARVGGVNWNHQWFGFLKNMKYVFHVYSRFVIRSRAFILGLVLGSAIGMFVLALGFILLLKWLGIDTYWIQDPGYQAVHYYWITVFLMFAPGIVLGVIFYRRSKKEADEFSKKWHDQYS